MTYRVVISDYKMSDGRYEVIEGTEECVGDDYDYQDARFNALQHDTRYSLAWYQILHEGVWYECDSNGRARLDIPADPQEIPFTDNFVEDMMDDPEDYDLEVDSNGDYIIPTKSVPRKHVQ